MARSAATVAISPRRHIPVKGRSCCRHARVTVPISAGLCVQESPSPHRDREREREDDDRARGEWYLPPYDMKDDSADHER